MNEPDKPVYLFSGIARQSAHRTLITLGKMCRAKDRVRLELLARQPLVTYEEDFHPMTDRVATICVVVLADPESFLPNWHRRIYQLACQ